MFCYRKSKGGNDSSIHRFQHLEPKTHLCASIQFHWKKHGAVLVWNCNDIFIKLSQYFSLDEWLHMKKFWWFEQAFTLVFRVCSTRNRLLPVVMVEILCRLLVQHFWDQDLLASFKKVQWKKSDAVFVRKCYVMCFQNSTWIIWNPKCFFW